MSAVATLTNETIRGKSYPEISLVKKEFLLFEISDYHDVVQMLNDINLRMDFELHHVCSELAQNMLEENNTGTIKITRGKVINTVKYKNEEDCFMKCEKLSHGLQLAQSSKEKTWLGSSIGKLGSLYRGRGLSSILNMGWIINTYSTIDNQLVIEASKH